MGTCCTSNQIDMDGQQQALDMLHGDLIKIKQMGQGEKYTPPEGFFDDDETPGQGSESKSASKKKGKDFDNDDKSVKSVGKSMISGMSKGGVGHSMTSKFST